MSGSLQIAISSGWKDLRFLLGLRKKLLSGFEDEIRYRELSQRLINYLKPEFSSNKEKDNFHEFIKERLLTNGPWKMTLRESNIQTNSLKN